MQFLRVKFLRLHLAMGTVCAIEAFANASLAGTVLIAHLMRVQTNAADTEAAWTRHHGCSDQPSVCASLVGLVLIVRSINVQITALAMAAVPVLHCASVMRDGVESTVRFLHVHSNAAVTETVRTESVLVVKAFTVLVVR